jgi:hypothetical protein
MVDASASRRCTSSAARRTARLVPPATSTSYLRTGYRSDGLLDVHFVTDEDIANQTSYAAKIDAITDAARPLAMEPAEP